MRSSSKILVIAMGIGLPGLLALRAGAAEDAGDFRPLFNGRDLTGWKIERGDPALWAVEDGVIVGRSQDYRTRSFLLTDREYSDFVLRLEFNLDEGTGGAVALRAKPDEELPYANGSRAYDHPMLKLIESPGREETGTTHWLWSRDLGGVYLPPDRTAQLHPAGSWNLLEIEVKGRTLRASLNGKLLTQNTSGEGSSYLDGFLPGLNREKGRIGLQKHTGTVRFRNIQVKSLAALEPPVPPQVTAPEDPGAFQPLFNGRDLAGWKIEDGDDTAWTVQDGVLVGFGQDYRARSHLVSDREFSDYVLRLDFNLAQNGGSGIGIRSRPGEVMPHKDGPDYPYDHPQLKMVDSPRGREQTGSSFWLRTDDSLGMYLKPDRPAVMNPAGSWNTMEVQVKGLTLRASVNGKPVLDITSEAGATFPDGSLPGLNRVKGRISLQKHTGTVRFRNVRVSPLDAPEPPHLVLDAEGHTGGIGALMFTPDGRELISLSDDQTVRFWDLQTGRSTRVLRPRLIPGGRAGAGALSPDGTRLAVARIGATPADQWIDLIELPAGRIVKVIPAEHKAAVSRLEFSPDGRRFATCGDDVRVWDARTGTVERVLRGHTSRVLGLAFSPDGRLLATSSGDESARVWSVETGETQATLKDAERRTFTLNSVTFSADGRTLATTSWGDQVRIWDVDGTLRKRLPFGGGVVRFTANPSRLFVGSERGSFVVDVEDGTRTPDFRPAHVNGVWSCALSPDGKLAATAGAGGDTLYAWSIDDAREVHHLAGKGRPVWGVGWSGDGRKVAWGHTGGWVTFNKEHPLERTFDLTTLSLEGHPEETFERARRTEGELSVRHNVREGSVTFMHADAEGPTYRAEIQGGTGAFSFVPGRRVALSNFGRLGLLDPDTGREVFKFNAPTGAREIAVSRDDRYLLTGSIDGVVRVWAFGRADPLVSLFVAEDNWVAWTPEGYYAASPGGEQLMGWQVNNGTHAMGTFYPASQFRKTLYRPDVIKRLLEAGSLDKALADADAAAGQQGRRTEVTQVLPPKVTITSPATAKVPFSGKPLKIEATARSVGANPVTEMRVLLDGRPLPNAVKAIKSPVPGEVHATWTVEVPPGSQSLTVQASSAVSKGLSEPLDIVGGGDDSKATGKLYLLVIGINDYLYLGKRNNLDSAVPDARSIHKSFQDLSRPLFRSVESRMLLDKQATRANILDSLQWLKKNARPGDKAIVFYAGHGDNQATGQFYILPVDTKLDDLRGTGISDDDLKKAIGDLPCTTVLMLDACYSGGFGEKKRKTRGLSKPTDALAGDMINDYGLATLCGARDNQTAIEEGGHGFFTLALTQGLAGEADTDKDGLVELYELLPFVCSKVRKLSAGDQVPTFGLPQSIESFPMSKP